MRKLKTSKSLQIVLISIFLGAALTAQVTREHVEAYVLELKQRVSSVTVYGSIAKLRRLARIISPHQDFRWLAEIEGDLRWEMRPKPKTSHRKLS